MSNKLKAIAVTDIGWCLRHNKNLFLQKSEGEGFGVYERGTGIPPTLVSWGKTPSAAWKQCRLNISNELKQQAFDKMNKEHGRK